MWTTWSTWKYPRHPDPLHLHARPHDVNATNSNDDDNIAHHPASAMEYLPEPARKFLEGGIDPYSQQQLEWYSTLYLCVLVLVAFGVSFATKSVAVALQIFAVGFIALLVATVPGWPYLNSHPIKFLKVRKSVAKA
ncbi:uncharacterized protein LOC62_06G008009 [Vanrija pseudolonga]|uniref:Signal peptidase complex subunit 1 n=1 Tax=Vanrija pseudolonga TaxID=143232 RepID=A0AAF0YD43_9TREE|nr:hypothetical protein LOC62_06G008009 [Vanrija pseudolonga]